MLLPARKFSLHKSQFDFHFKSLEAAAGLVSGSCSKFYAEMLGKSGNVEQD